MKYLVLYGLKNNVFFYLYQSSLSHKHLVKQFLIFINVFKLVKLWCEKIRTTEGEKMEIIDVLDNISKKILLQILGIKEIKCDKKSEIFC